VVAEQAGRDADNLSVHPYSLSLLGVSQSNPASGIGGGRAYCKVPFVFGEAGVVLGVDDGVLAACEGYSPEGVAVAEAAIDEQQAN
jgi:hypothetical protein